MGETEKSLAAHFDQAHNREWILFFDEPMTCWAIART